MTRDEYNTEIVLEALACQDDMDDAEIEDGDWDDDDECDTRDPEIDAQVELIAKLKTENAPDRQVDAAVDHLRGMLLISYLDPSDLPPVVERITDLLTLTPVQGAALAQSVDGEADAANSGVDAEFFLALALVLRGGATIGLNGAQAQWLYQNAYDLDSTLDPTNDPILASACEAVLAQLG